MTRRRLVSRVSLGVVIIVAFAVLISLGTWQLQRLAWKEGLIAAATERPDAAAVAAPGPSFWPNLDFDAWDYRRVALNGTFGDGEAHSWVNLASPRGGSLRGEGYFVVAPFRTGDGWWVLVNRGFVPADKKAPATRPDASPPSGSVRVEGIVRRDDVPNFVTPAPDLDDNIWFVRHIVPMAEALGVDPARTAPYSVDLVAAETPESGLPQAGESLVTFSNNHLQYALTWYGLAGALVGVVGFSLWRRRQD